MMIAKKGTKQANSKLEPKSANKSYEYSRSLYAESSSYREITKIYKKHRRIFIVSEQKGYAKKTCRAGMKELKPRV